MADIPAEGIKNFDVSDIEYGKRWGYTLKLLAIAKWSGGKLQLRVQPAFIHSGHILANVKGEDNAILVKGDLVGESLFCGKGAGRLPTSSAVVADIIDIAKNVIKNDRCIDMNNPRFLSRPMVIDNADNLSGRYYSRLMAIDKPGVLAAISNVFSKFNISVASVYQVERKKGQAVPVVFMTHEVTKGNIMSALKVINRFSFVKNKPVCIRIER